MAENDRGGRGAPPQCGRQPLAQTALCLLRRTGLLAADGLGGAVALAVFAVLAVHGGLARPVALLRAARLRARLVDLVVQLGAVLGDRGTRGAAQRAVRARGVQREPGAAPHPAADRHPLYRHPGRGTRRDHADRGAGDTGVPARPRPVAGHLGRRLDRLRGGLLSLGHAVPPVSALSPSASLRMPLST